MDEAVVKRIMPHSNEAEQAVIGSMMMDQEAITVAMEKLSDADFYNKQYGSLFKAMVELYNEGREGDLVTIKTKLEEMDVPSEVISMDQADYLGNDEFFLRNYDYKFGKIPLKDN